MKRLAIAAFVLAIVVRFAMNNPFDMGFPISSSTHFGYPIKSILFWALLVLGIVFSLAGLRKRTP